MQAFIKEHLLSLIIWAPVLSGVLTLLIDQIKPFKNHTHQFVLIAGFVNFAMAILLYWNFDTSINTMQFTEQANWITTIHARYALGVDGISMLLIALNSFITFTVLIANAKTTFEDPSHYWAAFLIMSGSINGVFASVDALLFYLFFEAMLIPMYLIIGIWGGPQRVYAALKFFLYTLLGSLLMLIAIIYLYQQAESSFDLLVWQQLHLPIFIQSLLFGAFFLSFAVKIPMWPIHTWLPDAHVEAPTGGSMILAAITLKIGAYGFLRFVLPILSEASRLFAPFIIVLSLIAIVYIGLVALAQTDMKKLIAYSSISHMGFVTLGLFLFSDNHLNKWALEGAIIQMISHGFISAALFMCVGILYDRIHSRQIKDYGGVANKMPIFAAFMMLFAMANAALPGTSGFVGEFMIVTSAIKTSFWIATLAGLTLILSAAYTLWMYKRVLFGEIVHSRLKTLQDINGREFCVLTLLVLMILFLGLYPAPFVDKLHPAIDQLMKQVG